MIATVPLCCLTITYIIMLCKSTISVDIINRLSEYTVSV